METTHTLQHTATHCNTLQHTATHRRPLIGDYKLSLIVGDLSIYGDYKLVARHRDRAFYAGISDLILDGCETKKF